MIESAVRRLRRTRPTQVTELERRNLARVDYLFQLVLQGRTDVSGPGNR